LIAMRRLAAVAALCLASACAGTGTEPAATPASVASTGVTTTTAPAGTTAAPPPTTAPAGAVLGPEVIGTSVEGRPIEAWTIGDGPGRVYVVGSLHGDERPAALASPALLEALVVDPPPGVTVRWVVDGNPDGTAASTRDNAAEVDLNRNWPAPDFVATESHGPEPLSEPETIALAADLDSFDPVLVVALHAAREGPFTDPDGPATGAAHAFAAGASRSGRTWEVVPQVAWPTPGSLGTYLAESAHLPVVTVEPNRWDDPAAVVGEMEAGMRALLAAVAGPASGGRAPVCADHAIGLSCSGLRRALDDVTGSGVSGAWAFLVKEMGGPVLAARDGDTAYYPASAVKVLHAAAVLSSDLDLDSEIPTATGCEPPADGPPMTVRALLEAMLVESDNAATNALQFHLGTDAMAAVADAAGMVDTDVHHAFGCGGPANAPANRTTSADLVSLLEAAVDGGLLPPGPSLLDAMADESLRVGAPPGWRVVVKDGVFEDIRTVTGVVEIPGDTDARRIAFALLATGVDQPVAWTIDGWVVALVAALAAD
jgi:protein MpaA